MASNLPVNERNRVFISYSYSDQEFVERLVNALHEAGEDVWWDKWELSPGDSLIQKIFEEGLAQAKAVIVVLSPQSVQSKWVREELDVATVRKIEGVTRIIPVLSAAVEIPMSLRSLLWVDMRSDFAGGVQRIVNVLRGVTAKPPRANVKRTAANLPESFDSFSRAATAVALFILNTVDLDSGLQVAFSGQELEKGLGLDPRTLNDAVDELKEAGLVRTLQTLGTAPYEFYQVEPTYVLFREFAQFLPYSPDEDIRIVAAAVAATGRIDGSTLAARTSLSPGRINRAVAYLEDYGVARVRNWLGTRPFDFGDVQATRRTRQFAEQT